MSCRLLQKMKKRDKTKKGEIELSEKEIYQLEKDLIKRHTELRNVRPRKIKFVHDVSYCGRASTCLEINKDWLKTTTKKELIEVLKHELAHYAIPGKGLRVIHSDKFIRLCNKLGCGSEDFSYSNKRLIEENRLFGRTVESLIRGTFENPVRITILRKPNWEVFRGDVLYSCTHMGDIFRSLRERMGKSRKQVARKMGVSEYTIKKLESAKDLYSPPQLGKTIPLIYEEEFQKKLFMVLTS